MRRYRTPQHVTAEAPKLCFSLGGLNTSSLVNSHTYTHPYMGFSVRDNPKTNGGFLSDRVQKGNHCLITHTSHTRTPKRGGGYYFSEVVCFSANPHRLRPEHFQWSRVQMVHPLALMLVNDLQKEI